MVRLARQNPAAGNLRFRVGSERLESVAETFDVILDRHAPFDLAAIAAHLRPGGYFLTQQVGERNMARVKAALDRPPGPRPIQPQAITASGLRPVAFMEYDVEYVVRDIESLILDPAAGRLWPSMCKPGSGHRGSPLVPRNPATPPHTGRTAAPHMAPRPR